LNPQRKAAAQSVNFFWNHELAMIQIGKLQVSLEHRDIRLHGERVRISCRAFDILELLVEKDGALVSKEEIMRRVWPNTIVEENNLQVHIAAIRKALGADREMIVTAPGRGYRLTGVKTSSGVGAADMDEGVLDAPSGHPDNPLLHASALVGRQCDVAKVLGAIEHAQLVTLVGSGGVGKTRVAVEAARLLLPRFPDGVAFVSLAPVSDRRLVLNALTTALGVKISPCCGSLAHIAHELSNKRLLIVLDNCEHLVVAAAAMAEVLAAAGNGIRVLATSREALRVRNEVLCQVPPLEVPDRESPSCEVLQAGAVQLFLSRARAVDPQFSSDEHCVCLIGEVCRRLDGIPLAIELAAARAAVFGLEVLATRLDDGLRILSGGCRTASPRHQTLKATLDWSYRLLNDTERGILCWLGVFVDTFTFDAVCHVGASQALTQVEVMDALEGLVLKSLVIRTGASASPRYRLLKTTRAYALQQLDDNGARNAASLAHATWFCESFKGAERGPEMKSPNDRLADFRHELGNVLAALHWAFLPTGNRVVGIELSTIAVRSLFDLSLIDECCSRARVSLDAARNTGASNFPVEAELTLTASWATTLECAGQSTQRCDAKADQSLSGRRPAALRQRAAAHSLPETSADVERLGAVGLPVEHDWHQGRRP
jgi:predicted ATPase/DNA-binding winged helix-turn-helix (wHTH) protein